MANPDDGDLVVYLTQGLPGTGQIGVRITPAYERELTHLLDEQGIRHNRVMEFAAGTDLAICAVAAGGTALSGLAQVLKVVLDRHDQRRLKVSTNNEETVETLVQSVGDLTEVLTTMVQEQAERDEAWKEVMDRIDRPSRGEPST